MVPADHTRAAGGLGQQDLEMQGNNRKQGMTTKISTLTLTSKVIFKGLQKVSLDN